MQFITFLHSSDTGNMLAYPPRVWWVGDEKTTRSKKELVDGTPFLDRLSPIKWSVALAWYLSSSLYKKESNTINTNCSVVELSLFSTSLSSWTFTTVDRDGPFPWLCLSCNHPYSLLIYISLLYYKKGGL